MALPVSREGAREAKILERAGVSDGSLHVFETLPHLETVYLGRPE